jgi:hypothetical protein
MEDGQGLINGLAIAEEIRVFKEKLTAARELLLVSCHSISRGLLDLTISRICRPNTLVGVDEILDQIREIKELQKSQLVRK